MGPKLGQGGTGQDVSRMRGVAGCGMGRDEAERSTAGRGGSRQDEAEQGGVALDRGCEGAGGVEHEGACVQGGGT